MVAAATSRGKDARAAKRGKAARSGAKRRETMQSGAHLQIGLGAPGFKTTRRKLDFPRGVFEMCAGQLCVACAAGPMFTSLLCDNCTGFFMKRVCGECVTKGTGCDILTCALCTQLFCQKGGESVVRLA